MKKKFKIKIESEFTMEAHSYDEAVYQLYNDMMSGELGDNAYIWIDGKLDGTRDRVEKMFADLDS